MAEPLIPGGYILLSRKLIESEIFRKPPLYLKVWIYLLSKAQHKEYKQLKRGQLWTSIPEIQEACSWYVGFRKETPTKDQVFNIIEWLRCESGDNNISTKAMTNTMTNTTMITTTKATQGMLIFIENFNFYQTSKNYESNDENNDESGMKATTNHDNINKNAYKNAKNENIIISVIEYLNQKSNKQYKPSTASTIKLINARLKEGYTEEDIKKVIDIKCKEWTGTEYEKYLQPSTLFGSKFENYLNQKTSKGEKVNGILNSNTDRGTSEKQIYNYDRFFD